MVSSRPHHVDSLFLTRFPASGFSRQDFFHIARFMNGLPLSSTAVPSVRSTNWLHIRQSGCANILTSDHTQVPVASATRTIPTPKNGSHQIGWANQSPSGLSFNRSMAVPIERTFLRDSSTSRLCPAVRRASSCAKKRRPRNESSIA
jgi:hypothetical protein